MNWPQNTRRPQSLAQTPALRVALVASFVVALTVLVRSAFGQIVGEDEAYYVLVAHQWNLGTPPYVGAFDVKPPGSFALVALAEQAFGETIFAIKALEAAAVAATALALLHIGRRLFPPMVGPIAAVFWIVASLDLGGVQFPVELLASAFVSVGVAVGLTGRSIVRMAIAGVLVGAAATVKQPAVLECAPLVFVALTGAPGKRVASLVALAFGLGVAPLGFFLFYLADGHAGALIADAVLGALVRTKGDGITWGQAVLHIAPVIAPALPLPILALPLWVERDRLRAEPWFAALRPLVIWLAAAFVGVFAVRAMYDHYYITLTPALCLLAALSANQVTPRLVPARWARPAQLALCLAFVAYFLAWPAALLKTGKDEVAADREAAQALRTLGQRPEGRTLVMERHLAIYVFARAEPTTPIFHPMQVFCPFPLPDARDPVALAFAPKPAFVVIANPGLLMACDIRARRREIYAALVQDYCPVWRGHTFRDGAMEDWLTIYRRRDQPGAPCRADSGPSYLAW
jgi:hypothetical protein